MFPKQRKRKAEELKAQFKRLLVLANYRPRWTDISEASVFSSSTPHVGDNQKASGGRAENEATRQ